eukprot:6330911-Pyramimonas_sp.AAC.1
MHLGTGAPRRDVLQAGPLAPEHGRAADEPRGHPLPLPAGSGRRDLMPLPCVFIQISELKVEFILDRVARAKTAELLEDVGG